MRALFRIPAVFLVLVALAIPLAGYASDGPCPDDPELSQTCLDEAPPYFVVTNRSEEHLADRPGTGCQPFILKHPDCLDCTNPSDPNCSTIDVDVEVCQAIMAPRSLEPGDVYEMCCNCATNPDGTWVYRVRRFDGKTCPDPGPWSDGLPPGTGIDFPAPFIVGGLALLGAGLLTTGFIVRRRSLGSA
jgi:hypothetical protein